MDTSYTVEKKTCNKTVKFRLNFYCYSFSPGAGPCLGALKNWDGTIDRGGKEAFNVPQIELRGPRMKGYALSSSRDEMDFERAFEPLVPLKSEVRTVQGMFSVNCPGITTCMTPPHTQLSVHVLSSAGWFP